MVGGVVAPPPVASRVMLLGQAPGPHEERLGRPFAYTAGKTLFGWMGELGFDEAGFRSAVYIAAVCRCFPGKAKGGGDRVPDLEEIATCAGWLEREVEILRPELLIPVGKLAISQVLPPLPLVETVGRVHKIRFHGRKMDAIPLPHPSGVSVWPKIEPGRSLLRTALDLLAGHPAIVTALRSVERDQGEDAASWRIL